MKGGRRGQSFQGRLIRDIGRETGRLAFQESEKRAFQGGRSAIFTCYSKVMRTKN